MYIFYHTVTTMNERYNLNRNNKFIFNEFDTYGEQCYENFKKNVSLGAILKRPLNILCQIINTLIISQPSY